MKRSSPFFELIAAFVIVLALTPGRANADSVIATAGTISTNENSPVTFSILNLVTTTTDPITSIGVLAQASQGTVVQTGPLGDFTYTPNSDYFGSDSFQYEATDSLGDTGVSIIDITVHEVNLPPHTSVGMFQTTENMQLGFALSSLVSSTNGVAITSYLIGTPANGVIGSFDPSSGFVEYVPNTGFTGTDEFSYGAKAANGLESDNLLFVSVEAPSTAAPEPATLALLGVGLIGITRASWRGKRTSPKAKIAGIARD